VTTNAIWKRLSRAVNWIALIGFARGEGQPFNQGEVHPHHEVQVQWPFTAEILEPLEFIQVGLWKGYYADGLICLTMIPLHHGENDTYTVSWGNPGTDHWANPGDPPGQSHVPPHSGLACRWFANWSQATADPATLDRTIIARVTVRHDHNQPPNPPDDVYNVQIRIKIAGGPLKIENGVVAHAEAFDMHPVTVVPGVEWAWPWYCTDLNYNPFDYRSLASYAPSGLQKVNRFKSKAHWAQPVNVKLVQVQNFGGQGTFLNPNGDLQTLPGGAPNPQATKELDPTKNVLIAKDGDVDSEDLVTLDGVYVLVEDGTNIPLTFDYSSEFMHFRDEVEGKLARRGVDYNKFQVHRPTSLTDQSHLTKPYEPPAGKVGGMFVYQLNDQGAKGMPGVHIQERFISVPADLDTNFDTGHVWTTYRKGKYTQPPFTDWFQGPLLLDGLMGNQPDEMFYDPRDPSLLLWHEYWSGTTAAAEVYANYPWRTIPGTTTKQYLGKWLQSYDMIFGSTSVTHNVGPRHSADGPP